MQNVKPTARAVLINIDPTMSRSNIDAMEQKFFNQLVLSNGTLKTTYADRLPDVDTACNSLLSESGQIVRLLDIGISSGVTTHEWVGALSRDQIEFKMDAFDLCMDASIVSFGRKFHVLIDSAHRPLQFEFLGRAESNFLGESIARKIRRGIPVVALRIGYSVCKLIFGTDGRMTPVKLVSNRLKSSPDVRIFEYDLSRVDELPGEYEMIRAANILNLAYFDDAFLSKSIAKIKRKLAENGYFCVVRTNSAGKNNGTIYQLSNGALKPVLQIGDGSEIDRLVT